MWGPKKSNKSTAKVITQNLSPMPALTPLRRSKCTPESRFGTPCTPASEVDTCQDDMSTLLVQIHEMRVEDFGDRDDEVGSFMRSVSTVWNE